MCKDFVIKNDILIKYNGSEKIVKIPENIKIIGNKAFYQNNCIEEIILSNNCYKINSYAFCECKNLEKINLNQIEIIENSAFKRTGLKKLELSKTLLNIKQNVFCECKQLETINFYGKIISNNAFEECENLKSVIAENLAIISDNAFKNCFSLNNIDSKKIKNIKKFGFAGCLNLKEINLNNVKEISNYAFSNTGIEKLDLKNIKCIDANAFSNCKKLNEIKLKNITFLKSSVFEYCTNLKNIELNKVENIGSGCFSHCLNIENIKLEKIYSIGFGAFIGCNKIKEITIPETLTYIGQCFINCKNLEKIDINCRLDDNEINNLIGINNSNLTKISGPNIICEDGVIYNKEKTKLITYLESKQDDIYVIPESVEDICEYAFTNNFYLKKIISNNNLKIIDKEIFYSMENLKELEIPKNIEYLHEQILQKLNISIRGTKKDIEQNNFLNKYKNLKIIAKHNSLDELLDKGKSFIEANRIIIQQER